MGDFVNSNFNQKINFYLNPMATQGVKWKLTAILSADVEVYSRLMEEDEATTVQTLTVHRGNNNIPKTLLYISTVEN
jgi:hypothetical protein